MRDVKEGAEYKFFVVGPTGLEGYKRDPRAREVSAPDWNCIVRDPSRYLWHDAQFRASPFEDLIIYQFHIGTFYAVDPVDEAPTARGSKSRRRRTGIPSQDLDGRMRCRGTSRPVLVGAGFTSFRDQEKYGASAKAVARARATNPTLASG